MTIVVHHRSSLAKFGKRPITRNFALRLLPLLVLTGAPAFAAPTDQLVVTATREETRQFDLPESVGVLSGDLIDELKPTHPSELFERIPGVHQVWLGGDHHTTVIRQPINFNPLYLYLENGVPTRATGFFETNALFDVNIPQARSVEITKGPGSALYGSDGIAGLINVLTPLPPEAALAGEASVEGSTRGYFRGLFSLGGTNGKHGLQADVNLVQDDGWRDNTDSDRQLGTFTWVINGGGAVRVQNILMLARVDQESTGSNLNRDDFRNDPTRNTQPIAFRKVESVRFQSHIDIRMDQALLSITPYFRYNRIQLLPSFALGFDPHFFDTDASSFGAQVKYRHDLSANLRVIVGLDIDYTTGERADTQISLTREDGIITAFDEIETVYDFDAETLTISPYLHGEWQATDRLRIVAGVRFDYAEFDYTNNLTTVIDPTALHNRPPSQKLDFSSVSPKAGFTYDVTEALNAFFSYKRGFRTPTAQQLFRPGRSTLSTDLKPVKSDSFEVGLRGNLGDRVAFELSLYTMTLRDDILVFTNDETGVRDIRNAGRTRHRGIEVGLSIDITDSLTLAGAYAYNDHFFVEWMPVGSVDLSGNTINRAPRDIGNARLTWRPGFLNGGVLEVEYQHLGSYFLDDNNTRTYGGHDLVHIRGSVHIEGGFELYLRLHNLLNERYATNGRFNRFAGEELKPGQARTLFGGISASF
ncbi:MAG: TonB-dependent receptor [Alphaproteobacteria bacterium]